MVDRSVAFGAWLNPAARELVLPGPPGRVTAFHRSLDGYEPTPLVEIPVLAEELGVGRVFVKDESTRLGLPAFKVLGVSWAVARLLGERYGVIGGDLALPAIRRAMAGAAPVTLVTATDGNHGRALARIAATLGSRSAVVVPTGLPKVALDAIRREGAELIEVAGDYDAAVAHAARMAERGDDTLLVQDTAWPGYERVPGWIVEGYATLFREIDIRLAATGATADLIAVPTGVGSLLQAAVTHARCAPDSTGTAILAVEPDSAACVLASLRVGTLTTVPTGQTVMNGLNCGTPSSLAWPVLRDGLDASVAISDGAARTAMCDLASAGVTAGPSGAASLAGVRALLADPQAATLLPEARRDGATIVLLCTEGIAATSAG